MKRLLFHTFIIIFCVDYSISITNAVRKLLDELGVKKEWVELDTEERRVVFVAAAEKYSRVENAIIDVRVVNHIQNLLHRFIDRFCRSKKDVREAAQRIKDPPETVLPIRLTSARNNAKTASERKCAQKHILAFKDVYRQLMAILGHVNHSDNADITVFKKSLHGTGLHSNEAAALAGAQLYSELSEKSHNEKLTREIDCTNKEAVISALKFWNINGENVIGFAVALHDLRSFNLST